MKGHKNMENVENTVTTNVKREKLGQCKDRHKIGS